MILESSGYHGTLYPRDRHADPPAAARQEQEPVGLTGYFPHFGYAVVMMDLRGTGKSQGCLDHLGPNDQKDLKTVIEWAATQPWSNGRVGMVGHSYVGSTPIIATKLNPKGLVTIVPSAGLASIYDHQFQAGVAWNPQLRRPDLGYPGLPPLRTSRRHDIQSAVRPTGDNFGDDRPQDTGCQFTQHRAQRRPAAAAGTETAWHPARDAMKEAVAWPGRVWLCTASTTTPRASLPRLVPHAHGQAPATSSGSASGITASAAAQPARHAVDRSAARLVRPGSC